MEEIIRANKRRSLLLVAGVVALLALVGAGWGSFGGTVVGGMLAGTLLGGGACLWAWHQSDQSILRSAGARPVTRKEDAFLFHTAEGLALAAGIPAPRMYLIEDSAPNAFATGRDPGHASICLTRGLLSKLDRLELEGVMAHEMAHVRNYDIRYMSMVAVLVGSIVFAADLLRRRLFWGTGRARRGRSQGALVLVAVAAAFLAPVVAMLLRAAVSRQREFLADASGAQLTRYPEGLARALEKIAADTEPLEVANRGSAHLYFVNPLLEYRGRVTDWFDTHPPTDERIRRLRSM
jgi:heat shock protein HtpX